MKFVFLLLYLLLDKILLPNDFPWIGIAGRKIRGFLFNKITGNKGTNINIQKNIKFSMNNIIFVDDNSGIGMDSQVQGPIKIGKNVMIGPQFLCFTQDHNFDRVDIPMIKQGVSKRCRIIIEDDVWIGARVTILKGVKIGQGSIVAAGSVVTRDIPKFSIYGGVPAQMIKRRV